MWRHRDTTGWEGLVVHVHDGRTGDPAVITEWVPAAQLRPA
ncbi:hypothetical protein [Segeticoccus rhizosphaerae]|nr:hypothetical protein [Ornithinicoccus soli]